MLKMFCKQPVYPGDTVMLKNTDLERESIMGVVASSGLAVVLKPLNPSQFVQHENAVYRLMGRYRETRTKDATNYPYWREIRWMVAL